MPKIEITFFLVILVAVKANLFCRGDFEEYSTTTVGDDLFYDYFDSNSSCWYNSGGGNLEVKLRNSGMYTRTCDMVTLFKYTLCQDVTLVPGEHYRFGFQMLLADVFASGSIQSKLNGANILLASISTGGEATTAVSCIFTGFQENNTFCFTPSYSYRSLTFGWGP